MSILKLHLLKNLMHQSFFKQLLFYDWSVDNILTRVMIAYGWILKVDLLFSGRMYGFFLTYVTKNLYTGRNCFNLFLIWFSANTTYTPYYKQIQGTQGCQKIRNISWTAKQQQTHTKVMTKMTKKFSTDQSKIKKDYWKTSEIDKK